MPIRRIGVSKGRSFEVTRAGKIVWEFWNPDIIGSEKPTRAIIYRMTRYEKDYLEEGLLGTPAGP